MKKIRFILGLHCHQPVGNFEHVFEHGYKVSYLPFLKTLADFPRVKAVLHYSGPLLEWLSDNHSEFFNLLGRLIERGQVEIMGGGHYEPILPAISHADRVGQLCYMSRYLKKKLGLQVRGAWLTERIWEPHLPVSLAGAGIEYVTVDDFHFLSAGFDTDTLHDYYLSEDEDSLVNIFPISEDLRYLVPFHEVEEVLAFFRRKAELLPGHSTIVLADDGEKFGMWPGTHDWVYNKGWLENFFSALTENEHWLETTTFSAVLDDTPPAGRVYLPAASYFEMGGWALPAEAGERFHALHEKLESEGSLKQFAPFLHGSFWRNFLVRYPESNWMQKRVNRTSRLVRQSLLAKGESPGPDNLPEPLRLLWMAQCNCAYWHGIFGGLYLPHLRQAIYNRLLKAEKLMREQAGNPPLVVVEETDVDLDGLPEVRLANDRVSLFIKPDRGGAIVELADLRAAFNLADTLARRREAYHSLMAAGSGNAAESTGHATIHKRQFNEPVEADAFVYDPYPRYSLREHFFAEFPASPDEAARLKSPDLGDFADGRFGHRTDSIESRRAVVVVLERTGCVRPEAGPLMEVRLEKAISLAPGSDDILIHYRLSHVSGPGLAAVFGISFNLTVLGPSDERVGWSTPGGERGSLESGAVLGRVSRFTVFNRREGVDTGFRFGRPTDSLVQYPVYTVSQSESGIDRTYQASCLLPLWRIELEPGRDWEMELTLSLTEG
ncbi:MAG: alpha-amylase/4-alpha-glucanotransferase domain-containing protein [Gemmatimonadota bacterium]|nr:alpha-amylase/4-alpha-glucanotransferase domain-containing protein [Gemmatimonadota bacterium]